MDSRSYSINVTIPPDIAAILARRCPKGSGTSKTAYLRNAAKLADIIQSQLATGATLRIHRPDGTTTDIIPLL